MSTVVYRHPVTGAQHTETALVVEVTPALVLLRSPDGFPYARPIDLVETIDGKPVA